MIRLRFWIRKLYDCQHRLLSVAVGTLCRCTYLLFIYQYSSVGRASASYAAGHRFEPGYWYQSCTWTWDVEKPVLDSLKEVLSRGKVDSLRENRTCAPSTGSRQALRDKGKHLCRRGVNGSITVSKTDGQGSSPCVYAKNFRKQTSLQILKFVV